jgi:acyl-CoA reductase-like NAD-dependent aldehyde dehydrogenase
MSDIDLSRLAPSDAVAALRSYPRRYRGLLRPVDDDDVTEVAHRIGPDGRSSIEIVSDVTRTFVVLGEALHQINVNPTPVVHAAVVDPAERQWDTPPPEELDDALTMFADEANALAEAVSRVATDAWTRTGTAAGTGAVISAIDVVREAVRVGRAGLTDIERTLDAVR